MPRLYGSTGVVPEKPVVPLLLSATRTLGTRAPTLHRDIAGLYHFDLRQPLGSSRSRQIPRVWLLTAKPLALRGFSQNHRTSSFHCRREGHRTVALQGKHIWGERRPAEVIREQAGILDLHLANGVRSTNLGIPAHQ